MSFAPPPQIPPPAEYRSIVRDTCANYWALAPLAARKWEVVVLPAGIKAGWIKAEIPGLVARDWDRLDDDPSGLVWLAARGHRYYFDPRNVGAGLVEAQDRAPRALETERWTEVARMPASNHDIMGTRLDGVMYVAGGLTAEWSFPPRPRAFDEIWALEPNHWTWRVAGRMRHQRIYCGTAAFDRGIWIIGGDIMDGNNPRQTVATVEIFSPESGIVSQGPDLTVARPMPLALVASGRLYVLGNPKGREDQPGLMESVGTGERIWRPEPPGPVGMGPLAGAALEDRLYVLIPHAGLGIFDPASKSWQVVPMHPAPRSCQMVAHRHEIWLMGGRDITDGAQTVIYNPQMRAFRSGPALPRPIAWGAAAELQGRIVVTGGAAGPCYNDRTLVMTDPD